MIQIINNPFKVVKNLLKILIKSIINNVFILKISPLKLILGDKFQRVIFLKLDFFNKSKEYSLFYQNLFRSTGVGSDICEEGYWESIHNHSTSIAGYVPYIKLQTSIIMYHFWAINYGLRKQALGHIILLKDKKVKKVLKFNLQSGQIRKFDLKKIFKGDGDIIFVEIFHPKFPKNHGGDNGHFRFWGDYSKNKSTVHSMPFPYILFNTKIPSCRATFADIDYKKNDAKIRLINLYENKPIKLNDHLFGKINFGYFIQSIKMSISSVWHSAEYTGIPSSNNSDQFQLVALPPIPDIDLQLSFIEAFTSNKKEEITFSIFDSNANFVKKKCLTLSHLSRIRCSEIFPGLELSEMQLLIDLSKVETLLHAGYLHLLYFCGNVLGDSVHSHALSAPLLFKKNKPAINNGYGQSLKFMHFPSGKAYKSFISIWTNDKKIPAQLRFIDDLGNEYIKNIVIHPLGVAHFQLDEILTSMGAGAASYYIVQFQSNTSNLFANVYVFNERDKSISVDHLTGG